jgi:uncharacterized membrane protein YczE
VVFKSLNVANLTRLMVGLCVCGFGLTLMLQAHLGLSPWDVLSQGVSIRLGIAFGTASILIGAVVLLFWIPLRNRPGFGTIANAILIGTWANLFLTLIPRSTNYVQSAAMFLIGLLLVGAASGLYISANLGAGPRDGLMLGLATKLGKPIWIVRTVVELTVLLIGWALGGQFREGTIIFAFTIGWLMQRSMKLFRSKTA